jgi:hypothetical protein
VNPAGRWRWPLSWALSWAVALVVAAGTGLGGEAPATAATADPEALPLTVVISELTPRVPKPGDTLTVRGEVHNPGEQPYDDVSVRLRVSPTELNNRTEIDLIAEGSELRDGLPVAESRTGVAGHIASQGRAGFALKVQVDDLRLPVNGVYVIGVEALGVSPDETAESASPTEGTGPGTADTEGSPSGGEPVRIGLQKTFLPWMPQANLYVPTRLSLLWPLASRPARDANGRLTSDALPRELASTGRLSALLTAVGTTPVTWVVDPELLDTVAAMAGVAPAITAASPGSPSASPSPTPSPAGSATPNPSAGADATERRIATEWLATAKRTLQGAQVYALPYADVDVQALARAGRLDQVDEAIRLGAEVTPQVLGRTAGPSLAWPADGFAESRTLDRLETAGATTFVLDSRAITATETLPYTPTGHAEVDTEQGSFDVLVADGGLTESLSGNLAGPDRGTLAAQRFLAETALITAERPNLGRSVLAVPPRRWAPTTPWLARLLGDLSRAPWVRLAGLDELHRTDVPAQLDGATLAYPIKAAELELSTAQLARARAAEQAAHRFTELFKDPARRLAGYDSAVLSSLSSAWRQAPGDGQRFVDRFAQVVKRDSAKVHIIGRGLVTLSSTSGTIPVTISNGLGQSVVVGLDVIPKVASRLQIVPPEPITIGPGRKTTIKVPAQAAANGITRVDVQLKTTAGSAYGPVVPVRVNATNYGTVGLIVVVVAAALLFVAAALRNIRRYRAGHRRTAAASPAGSQAPGQATTPTDAKIQA